MAQNTPIALTIAGSDSGGGAGIQADIKAMSANGVYAASVITAVTAQNTKGVTAIHEVPADVIIEQIDAVLSDLDVGAIKLGMLFSTRTIEAVAQVLRGFNGPIVVDPVMVAKSGDVLLQEEAIDALRDELLPLATLLTPNLPEAAKLLFDAKADSVDAMTSQGRSMLELGAEAVLVKGGHATGQLCIDVLVGHNAEEVTLTAPRVATQNTHGTGCTYSAAIAANLAKGAAVRGAVENAYQYLQVAVRQAEQLTVGQGHGPVHHFHNFWG
jgi:hydroxymethylpyrimidine/phosphomethylpyrimidine kinase